MATEHSFTSTIKKVLTKHFGHDAETIFSHSSLIQYVNEKTKSANKGSKARSSFSSLYSIYVIVEDYVNHNYHIDTKKNYSDYEGAVFSALSKRQRELPFGAKLQNHALNNRTNSEFKKFFPTAGIVPIIRNQETNRYWINENLLIIEANRHDYNIAEAIIEIINEYIQIKRDTFERFISLCDNMQKVGEESPEQIKSFIASLLSPNVDARLFEIASFSILKNYYCEQRIYWGFEPETVAPENLKLYKTGRTNANDGGIDFVMKPLGRFFQVTESLDFRKFFLDIEKTEKFPMSFVVKSNDTVEQIASKLEQDALRAYPVKTVVDKYLACIEEIINIPKLHEFLETVSTQGHLPDVLSEITLQSKIEFNYDEEDED